MNYIWYPLMEAIQADYDTTKINYRVCDKLFFEQWEDETIRIEARAHHISPLLEYLPIALYDPDNNVKLEDKLARVDVNPYHRFTSIFTNILHPDRHDHNDLIVCDIMTHMLAHIDRICGMCRHDFRILIVINEIEKGCYGDSREVFSLFSTLEKRALAEGLIMLYNTYNSLRSLDTLFNVILTDFEVRLRDNVEVVFYNPYGFDEREDKMLKFIIKLFLPIDFPYVIHWQYTYGSVDCDESMMLERFVF
ncbi:MAG: hypothetical protein FWH57_02160 [Oscillospiraceae bacterium]|nr:hypothetical protein [Oscillospiraceae bacterium]